MSQRNRPSSTCSIRVSGLYGWRKWPVNQKDRHFAATCSAWCPCKACSRHGTAHLTAVAERTWPNRLKKQVNRTTPAGCLTSTTSGHPRCNYFTDLALTPHRQIRSLLGAKGPAGDFLSNFQTAPRRELKLLLRKNELGYTSASPERHLNRNGEPTSATSHQSCDSNGFLIRISRLGGVPSVRPGQQSC